MANRSVGRVSRTRVSSVITPSFKGTLKSTRIKTRLPRKSTSLIVSLFMASSSQRSVLGTDSVRKRHPQQRDQARSELGRHEFDQVAAAAGVSPLVVVPGQHLYAAVPHHFGVTSIDNRGIRVALEIRGHQLFLGVR